MTEDAANKALSKANQAVINLHRNGKISYEECVLIISQISVVSIEFQKKGRKTAEKKLSNGLDTQGELRLESSSTQQKKQTQDSLEADLDYLQE